MFVLTMDTDNTVYQDAYVPPHVQWTVPQRLGGTVLPGTRSDTAVQLWVLALASSHSCFALQCWRLRLLINDCPVWEEECRNR